MKRALIFGRAQGVWDEVAAAHKLGAYDFIVGVGSAAVDYPNEIDDWVSFHSTLFPHWLGERAKKGFPPPRRLWSNKYTGSHVIERLAPGMPPLSYVWCEGGSSGRIAVEVAQHRLHCERIVLAGIPMDQERGQYDSTKPWTEAAAHREPWVRDVEKMRGIVRSMSGWTQTLLGGEPPTREWLTGEAT